MQFRKVKVTSAVDVVVDQVKSMILDGALKPGDKLPNEIELARRLDVGRATVREALREIQSLGLVERTREGTFVRSVDWDILTDPLDLVLTMNPQSYSDLWECRIVLESANVKLASMRATDEDLEKLKASIDKMANGINSDMQFVNANCSFHHQIAIATHNAILSVLYSSLIQVITQAQMNMLSRGEGSKAESLDHHRAIYDAISRKNSEEAGRTMFEHLVFTRGLFREEDSALRTDLPDSL